MRRGCGAIDRSGGSVRRSRPTHHRSQAAKIQGHADEIELAGDLPLPAEAELTEAEHAFRLIDHRKQLRRVRRRLMHVVRHDDP